MWRVEPIYYLSMYNDPNNFTVFDDFLQLLINGFLSKIIGPLL